MIHNIRLFIVKILLTSSERKILAHGLMKIQFYDPGYFDSWLTHLAKIRLIYWIKCLIAMIILTSCSGRAWYGEHNGYGRYSNGFPQEQSCGAFANPQPMHVTSYNNQAYHRQSKPQIFTRKPVHKSSRVPKRIAKRG